MKSKLELYGLSVCFAAIVCLVVSGAIAAYAVVTAVAPSFTLERWVYERHASNDNVWEHKRRYVRSDKEPVEPRPAEAVLTAQRQEALQQALAVEQHSGVQLLVRALMFFLAGCVAFWTHWRISSRARTNAGA